MPFTPGPLTIGGTFRTHNHPERFWETLVISQTVGLAGTAHGRTQEEAEAIASFFALAPEMFTLLKDIRTFFIEDRPAMARHIVERLARIVESVEGEG